MRTKHAGLLELDPQERRSLQGRRSQAQGRGRRLRQDVRVSPRKRDPQGLIPNGLPQGHARSHRRDQGDAEDHQGHADGRGVQAAPCAGGGGSRASLCRAHEQGAGLDRRGGGRQRFRAPAAGRHRQRQGASAGGLHRRARPVRPVQFVDRAAGARADQFADRPGQGGQDPLRRPQGARPAAPRLRQADHRDDRAARHQADRLRAGRDDRQEGRRAVRRRRLRRLHAVLLALQVGDRADPDRAADHPAGVRKSQKRPASLTNTSRKKTKFSPTCCRAICRCRCSARCWKTPPPSRARA